MNKISQNSKLIKGTCLLFPLLILAGLIGTIRGLTTTINDDMALMVGDTIEVNRTWGIDDEQHDRTPPQLPEKKLKISSGTDTCSPVQCYLGTGGDVYVR